MPIFYLDTSAIVKSYREERGTEVMARLLGNPTPQDRFYTSFLSTLELTSGILRLAKGGQLRENMAKEILARFRRDIQQLFLTWPLDNSVVDAAVTVVEQHKLRSGDLIHLATATSISSIAAGPQVVLVAADGELLGAAAASGLDTLDLRTDDSLEKLEQMRRTVR